MGHPVPSNTEEGGNLSLFTGVSASEGPWQLGSSKATWGRGQQVERGGHSQGRGQPHQAGTADSPACPKGSPSR